jgi:hypothetical protein
MTLSEYIRGGRSGGKPMWGALSRVALYQGVSVQTVKEWDEGTRVIGPARHRKIQNMIHSRWPLRKNKSCHAKFNR